MTTKLHAVRGSRAILCATLLSTSAFALAQNAPIVQPGAPGQDSRELTADEAIKLASARYTQADVKFMQHMIEHHRQAVVMAQLAEGRTNNEDVVAVAGRILAGQDDEIQFMQEWLATRGEAMQMPASMAQHARHMMKGMASPQDLARLRAASGAEFDRLFLSLMIAHHEGAIDMVDALLEQPGSAADPILFRFIGDVENEQKAELDRMDGVLAGISEDPRASLTPGFADAGEAIWNMRKVASLSKPAGFFDPENPADLRAVVPPRENADEAAENATEDAATAATVGSGATAPDAVEPAENADPERGEGEGETLTQFAERSPLLDFANTDMAFFDDIMVAGNYHGFNIYRLGADGVPNLMSSVVCPGGQGDVSVVENLLIMSVEQTRGRVDCGLQGVEEDVSAERFRGLRIFDISDLMRPRQVGGVQTCRGSHTHSVVSADDQRIIVYNSGTSSVREQEELSRCIDNPSDSRTALFSIDVIEIPVANPAAARIVASPRVFADNETGEIAGLWKGGDSGDGTQRTAQTNQCHDITVFPSKNLAAGACSGNGILMDISDPMNPRRIDSVFDKGFAYWHSATFNNDGTKVIFTDEWGGGGRPRCRASDPTTWGADAIYDIENGKLEFRSHYKMPGPQGEFENCVAHNGSIVPVPGRDIFVQSWYQGGISVMDFTDSDNPREIAYFDRGAIDDEQLVVGGYWSSYWYDGRIYGTEITRGIDVFALEPSQFLTQAEIAAAESAQYKGERFNPQTQTEVTWSQATVDAVEASRQGG